MFPLLAVCQANLKSLINITEPHLYRVDSLIISHIVENAITFITFAALQCCLPTKVCPIVFSFTHFNIGYRYRM